MSYNLEEPQYIVHFYCVDANFDLMVRRKEVSKFIPPATCVWSEGMIWIFFQIITKFSYFLSISSYVRKDLLWTPDIDRASFNTSLVYNLM